ncbi:MAG TPA: hypothetical protein VHD31_00135 [Candidatus Paceibacterota bacterium]|nr:hypothetical protein [Candidatus Paceibacterota bacterium]
MATRTALKASTTLTADSRKGQEAVAIFRAQYNKAGLDDEAGQLLIESKGFAAYLAEGIRTFSQRGPVFPVYLEIKVGGKSKDELLAELKSSGCSVSDWAKDIMSKPAWKPGKKETVKFARVTIRDLGFTKNPTTAQIWARIRELGHSLCEPGDGPAIRLELKDQLRGDYFWTAMKQITDSGGRPSVFSVGRSDGGRPWLGASWAGPDNGWDLDGAVVFRLRK